MILIIIKYLIKKNFKVFVLKIKILNNGCIKWDSSLKDKWIFNKISMI
jgi:hypothetical protein